MNAVISATPVLFIHPISGHMESIPVEMIAAYLPYATHLNLEQAAKVAAIHDEEAAMNLFEDVANHYSVCSADGTGFDILAVEPPSLR